MVWKRTFVTNGAIFAFGLVGGVVVARSLGPGGRGALEVLTYWPHFIAGFAALGLNEAITIKVSRDECTQRLASTAFILSIGQAAVLSLVLLTLLPFLLRDDRAALLPEALIYSMIFLPATFISQNLLAIVQGSLDFRRFNTQRLIQSVIYPTMLIGFILAEKLDVLTAATSMLAGTVVVALLRIWDVKSELFKKPQWADARGILTTGLKLHLASIAIFLSTQIDSIILVYFGTNHELGLYIAALVFGRTGIGLLVQTYITITLPTIARVESLHKYRSEILRHLAILSVVSIGAVVVGLFLLPMVIPLLMGDGFVEAVSCAQILLLAFAVAGIRKAMIYVLRSRLKNLPAILVESVTAILVAIIGYFSFISHGLVGLSTAVLLANSVGTLLLVPFFTRELRDVRSNGGASKLGIV